jgi:DME family drug/metabolite transporter
MAGVFVLAAVLALPVLAAQPLGWLVTTGGVALAIHLGLVTLAVGYTLYGWGLERLPVPTVVTLTLAEPLTASLLGVAVLGERLGTTGWIGVALISAGLTLAARGGAEPEREALPLTP